MFLAVTASVVGNFRNPEELDVIIAYINRIKHYLVTPEGLKLHRELPIFGRIATLNKFRLPGEAFFLLDRFLIMILTSSIF